MTNIYEFENGPVPSALLSDMDGLLLDTEKLSKISFDDVSGAYDIPNGDDIFSHLIGLNKPAHLNVFSRMLPAGIDPDIFDQDWMKRYLNLLEDDIPVKSGVRAFLQHCADLGMAMAVVTSTNTTKAEGFLDRAGLLDRFNAVIGGDQVENGKPYPDIYLRAAAVLSCPISDSLALEDSNNGVIAAYQSGAKVLQIPDIAPQSAEVSALNIPVLDQISGVPLHLGWPFP